MLFHRGWTIANVRITVTTKIGQNQTVSRSKSLRRGKPELVMNRKGMKQDNGSTAPENEVTEFSVVALDAGHERDLIIKLGELSSSARPGSRKFGLGDTSQIFRVLLTAKGAKKSAKSAKLSVPSSRGSHL
jgi:hypothetical protein